MDENKLTMDENKYRLFDTVIKIIGTIGVVLTLVIGVYKNSQDMEREYKKPFWENQLATCKKASELASEMYPRASGKVSQKKINEYFRFYYGEAGLFLSNKVIKKMGELGKLAVQCNANIIKESECDEVIFRGKSMQIANLCRDMITKSWDISLEKLNSRVLIYDYPQ